MSEYTKGKMELNDIRPWEIWVGADIHIADVHGNHEARRANAKEIVRRWNAFEEGGIVSDLVKDGKDLLLFSECSPFCEDRKRAQDKFKITLAKARPE